MEAKQKARKQKQDMVASVLGFLVPEELTANQKILRDIQDKLNAAPAMARFTRKVVRSMADAGPRSLTCRSP